MMSEEYSDEFSPPEEDEETEVARKPPPKKTTPHKSKAMMRKSTTGKKSPRSSGSPLKARTSSASGKNVREMWLGAVNNRQTDLSSGRQNKVYTGRKSNLEYWTDTLRKSTGGGTGTGVSSNGMTGLKKSQTGSMSYGSTSHYLRQLVGTEKLKKGSEPTARAAPGTPSYKDPEEYYDEILGLKKQIVNVNSENSTLKSKLRRLEEDNAKKEREIDQLLDPSKSDEMRRTLADRKPDAGAVIHSLKQKIHKLESQVKDKENALSKIQSDMKVTKLEETRLQMESFYQEIVRLNQMKDFKQTSSSRQVKQAPVKESGAKLKALQDTILRMNENNTRLTQENKGLKQDLEKVMEEMAQNKEKIDDYEDMSKKQLLSSIARLEKRLEKQDVDNTSLASEVEGRRANTSGKIHLEGSIAQKLSQLDHRESELLEEIERHKGIIKKLKDDRVHYRKKCDDKDKQVKALRKDVNELQAELDSFYEKDKMPTPRSQTRNSPRTTSTTSNNYKLNRKGSTASSVASEGRRERDRQKRIKDFTENRAARKIQSGWKSHRQHADEEREEEESKLNAKVEEFRRKSAATAIQRRWRQHQTELEEEKRWRTQRNVKADALREKHAAKTIQHGWRDHRRRRQHEAEVEDAALTIQSALRGHKARRKQLRNYESDEEEEEEDEEEDLDEAATMIQSSYRGHRNRKDQLKSYKEREPDLFSEGSCDLDYAVITIQSAVRSHWGRKHMLRSTLTSPRDSARSNRSRARRYGGLDSAGEDDDEVEEDIEEDIPASSRRQHSSRPSSARSASSKASSRRESSHKTSVKKKVVVESDEDDDDDIVF